MKKHLVPALAIIITSASLLIFSGCISGLFSDKMTSVNFDTVYVGLSPEGVIKRLGKPTEKTGQTWTFIREKGGYRKAIIHFKDGVVYKKIWTFDR